MESPITPERAKNLDPSFLIAFVRENSGYDADLLQQIIDEWKIYKSMGLSPEEAVQLAEDVESRFLLWHKKRYGETAGKVMVWLEADRKNRLVVFKQPRLPLIWGDKEQNTVLCPNCERDLMGGYECEYPSEETMYQCPYCGQPIDATKALTRTEFDAMRKD